MVRILFLFLAAIPFYFARAADGLVVHEWGTFTSLQDEDGVTLGGVNNEEEELPAFVYDIGNLIQQQSRAVANVALHRREVFFYSKGVTALRQDVTMRLETPVVYFHLPAGSGPVNADLAVRFNGGYLTQYYPFAAALPTKPEQLRGYLNEKSVGSLSWTKLVIGAKGEPPASKSPVWNAPRNVSSSRVSVANAKNDTETEQFLFYRGIGNVYAPLKAKLENQVWKIYPGDQRDLTKGLPLPTRAWVYERRDDGSSRWGRLSLEPKADPNEGLAWWHEHPVAYATTREEYDRTFANLKADLEKALMDDGMFKDEALALLNTWEESYFKNPGLRVFYMVPRAWTDAVLPLNVHADIPVSKIERAMIGRIELVQPHQRALLARIVSGRMNAEGYKQSLEAYKKMGRFRACLLLNAQRNIEWMVQSSFAPPAKEEVVEPKVGEKKEF